MDANFKVDKIELLLELFSISTISLLLRLAVLFKSIWFLLRAFNCIFPLLSINTSDFKVALLSIKFSKLLFRLLSGFIDD